MHSFLTNLPPAKKLTSDVLEIKSDPSIGITEIRTIQTFLSKKPIQSDKNTVIVHNAHTLTSQAQQAFLKTLEEPPSNSEIYLVTPYPDQLLPTILSRVQIINPSNESNSSHSSNLTYSQELFQKLLSSEVRDRLLLLDQANFTRDSALEFLNDLEQILHQSVTNSELRPPLKFKRGNEGVLFSLILTTRTYLKANVTIRLAMDNFVINLI